MMYSHTSSWLNEHKRAFFEMSEAIWEHPETAFQEKFALQAQCKLLNELGFTTESNVFGLETAYKAVSGNGKSPCVAFAAEYDALPEIGHACGHNLIAMTSIAAFAAANSVLTAKGIDGKLVLLGTPGEESAGGKVKMLSNGCLDDVDMVLTAHPSFRTTPDTGSTGIRRFTVEFHGHSAHAAVSPELGLNALDAVMLLFNGINAWRQQLPENARIHGIVLKGGVVPNIIPDYASCRFFLRSTDEKVLDGLEKRFHDIVKGAELMTGTTAVVTPFKAPYQSRKANTPLNERFIRYAREAGLNPQIPQSPDRGSSDFGNFSRKRPGIHPYFAISSDKVIAFHSVEFREAANTGFARENALKTAAVLASIALDYLSDHDFREAVRQNFDQN